LSRGDLTEAEWRILKALLPIEPENRVRGRRPEQNPSIINGIEPQAYIAGVIAKIAGGWPASRWD